MKSFPDVLNVCWVDSMTFVSLHSLGLAPLGRRLFQKCRHFFESVLLCFVFFLPLPTTAVFPLLFSLFDECNLKNSGLLGGWGIMFSLLISSDLLSYFKMVKRLFTNRYLKYFKSSLSRLASCINWKLAYRSVGWSSKIKNPSKILLKKIGLIKFEHHVSCCKYALSYGASY